MEWLNELTTQGAATLWVIIIGTCWVAAVFFKGLFGGYLPQDKD